MTWFDAGVNLLDGRFDANEVIANACAAGVSKLCVITTHPKEWDDARTLYEAFPEQLVYTLGVHPHNAKDVTAADLQQLESLCEQPGLVAVGECDFNRDFSPRPVQIDVFQAQLEIAKRVNKPVYLHERDAFSQQLECLESVFGSHAIDGIAHCFTGTKSQLHAYIERGLYIGVTGWLCDEKRGQSLREAVAALPLDKLIFETDAPYLFPKTVRPRKRNNEPALLPHIAEEFAQVTGHSFSKLAQISYTNTLSLFRLS